ncbi:DNA cross-link repair protein PSO2/SNM1 [Spathaspora sp. JA1]|nr:DNA cross-link repair protein PSO2/SNM1 [Spathaspora sp. JA1]
MSLPLKKQPVLLTGKKQRSIFEFSQNKIKSLPSEIIEIHSDGNEECETIKDEESSAGESFLGCTTVEDVSCPICQLSISHLTIRDRTDHVDTCLVRVSFVEEPLKPEKSPTIKSETKKRKVIPSQPPDEKSKYINKEIKPVEKSGVEIAIPKAITKSKTKRPIPSLKTMTFPIQESPRLIYQVSVDAFCYEPHETISQYFLSHFHSDHYGGISKKWAYERVFKEDIDFENESKYRKIIYCSVITGKLLTLHFSIDPKFIRPLEIDTRYKIKSYTKEIEDGGYESNSETPGLYVTSITANHCPGSVIFLFESIGLDNKRVRVLHCGDFRVNFEILNHSLLKKFTSDCGEYSLDKVYLDTTYMSPSYNFPKQELVCDTVATMFQDLIREEDEEAKTKASLFSTWFGTGTQSRITDFWKQQTTRKKKKFLILVGTYVIGKEKLAITISKRLNCQIYVSNIGSRNKKLDTLKTYNDTYLNSVLTTNDLGDEDSDKSIIHLVPMNIVSSAQELSNYFNHNKYFDNFERCVGLRPTGWSFNPGQQRGIKETEISRNQVQELEQIMEKPPSFNYLSNILSQVTNTQSKGKPDKALYRIYSLPYSEHSSFRELAYFVIFFNIHQVIPTVNCENERSIKAMNNIIEIWEFVRRIRANSIKSTDDDYAEQELIEKIQKLSLDSF